MNNLVFVRHGFNSNASNMEALAEAVSRMLRLESADLNNQNCDNATVLCNGLRLAGVVARKFNSLQENVGKILLIGHSQGGLVCRVAAAAICAPDQLEDAIQGQGERYVDNTYRLEALKELEYLRGQNLGDQLLARCARHLLGVVTLATPNAGVMTHGQLSLTGRALKWLATGVANLLEVKTIGELTTARLFRILQHVRIQEVKYLSISGSSVNRYSALTYSDLQLVPTMSALGLHLEMPNDGLVEDISVDLRESPLPSEIADLEKQYTHVRCYIDCLDISHTAIHSRQRVFCELARVFSTWGLNVIQPST